MTAKGLRSEAEFSREDTKAIKGIAVILMLFHHLAAFPDRFPVGFEGFRTLWARFAEGGYLRYLAISAKMCVALFFFMGGYGLYKRYESRKLSVSRSIMEIYFSYWKVFVIFIPIALIFFAREGADINPLATIYHIEGKKMLVNTVIANFTAWSDSLNGEWWFVGSYICALPMGYLFCSLTKRLNNFWIEILIVFGVDILIKSFFPALAATEDFAMLHSNVFFRNFLTINGYATVFFAGIVVAKHDAICVIKKRLREYTFAPMISVVGLAVLYWSRSFLTGDAPDIVYMILMVPMMSVVLDSIKPLRFGCAFLGKHSTNIWLVHSFFLYYFLEITHIVYLTQNVWVDLLILLFMSLGTSILLESFYRGMGWLWRFGKDRIAKRKKPSEAT